MIRKKSTVDTKESKVDKEQEKVKSWLGRVKCKRESILKSQGSSQADESSKKVKGQYRRGIASQGSSPQKQKIRLIKSRVVTTANQRSC